MKDPRKILSQNDPKTEQEPQATEEQIQQIKEIIHLLAKTVSQVKIYPPDHSTVKNFRDELLERLTDYLEKHWKLEIDVGEFTFLFQDHTVYHDSSPMKSLPFLFFKDGMQKLFFYKGLNEDQLQEFLEMIKTYYELSPEESDVVSLMWEKDFANIRYFAPDDYLETKIGVGKQPVEIHVDRQLFQTGTIELSPDDKAALARDIVTEAIHRVPEEKKETPGETRQADRWGISSLDERESQTLKSMLETNRKISPEEELYLLVIEMLRLEEDGDRFSTTLGVLAHNHKDIIQKRNFPFAAELLNSLTELRQFFTSSSPEKIRIIDSFFHEARNRESLDSIKEILLEKEMAEYESFFDYLEILNPEIIFLGELYEEIKSADFRLKTLNYLKRIGKTNYAALMDIADEERTTLTKEIISILSSVQDRKATLLLANFIPYRNTSIKRAAVESLGKIKDSLASKILIGFMADEDEELRILAVQNIHSFEDISLMKPVMQTVQDKAFKKKSTQEKQAYLDLLARSRSKEAFRVLQNIIMKTGFFSRPKRVEISLQAIKALEAARTPEAVEILRNAIKARKKRLRQAARLAIETIPKS